LGAVILVRYTFGSRPLNKVIKLQKRAQIGRRRVGKCFGMFKMGYKALLLAFLLEFALDLLKIRK
jgi:hypothetical protein